MSNTTSIKNQGKLKREIVKITKHPGRVPGDMIFTNPKLNAMCKAFCEGPIRYGNKLHAEARLKVVLRREERSRNKRELQKIIPKSCIH